ncbi:MAG: hypothetical protein IJW49_01325 [Clostridia bacterium]|nr:hypothetical protein [Clostridia bacterium]
MNKKVRVLSLLLVLVMTLTFNVTVYAEPAAAGSIDVTGKSAVTVDSVTYTVIYDLSAITTGGNYILANNVSVSNTSTFTIPAGTVLNGNGYTISVAGNSEAAPLSKVPFVLGAGAEIKFINVKFGEIDAPIVFKAVAPASTDDVADDLSLFIEEVVTETVVIDDVETEQTVPVTATFEDVAFSVYASDELVNVNTAAVVAVAAGTYKFEGCTANIELDTGNMSENDGGMLTKGYTGGFVANAVAGSSVSFNNCQTAEGSTIEADWRTGGFVGTLDGAASFTNCTNNAKITNLTLVTGGFVGWVGNDSGNNLSAWTMDKCTNNGEITAYMGPLQINNSNKTHSDASRSAGAMVGYVYKCETGTNPQWIVSNCINTGNIYGEDRLAGMVGDNRLTYQYDKSGVLFQNPENPEVTVGYNPLPALTIGCINYGDVVCIVEEIVSSAHILGGMFSRTQGPNTLRNCVNYGRVDANGMKDGHLGGMVGNTSAGQSVCYNTNSSLVLEGCVNYGQITNGRRVAGMIGCSEGGRTQLTNCANYGMISSGLGSAAHAGNLNDNGLIAGGIVGMADRGAHTLTNCQNYGAVEATHVAGGLVACTRNNGYTNSTTGYTYSMSLTIDTCANFADVSSADVDVGGLVGQSLCDVSIANSVNIGKLTAHNSFVASQLVCNAKLGISIENCYLFGILGGYTFTPDADGILGFNCDMGDSIVVPDGAVMAYVLAETVTDERNRAVALEDALKTVQDLYPNLVFRLGAAGENPIVVDGVLSDGDHNWSETVIIREPTCTATGVGQDTCSDCDNVKTYIIPSLGHAESEAIIVEEPTCHSYGSKKFVCSRCGNTEWADIPMIDHEYDSHRQYNGVLHESSCYCGASKLVEHNWDDGVIVVKPNCKADGSIIYTCTDCGQIRVETLAAGGHDHLLPTVENKTEATCTKDGSYDSVIFCNECNTEISRETITIPSEGHQWDNGVVTKNPTYVSDGVKTYTCACGETRTESIPKLEPDPETPRIVVESKTAPVGGTVKVSVSLADNPGVTAMYLTLLFDSNVLELISVEDEGLLNDSAFGQKLTSPYVFSWDDSTANSSNNANGKVVTFTFKVKSTAPIGATTLSITYDEGDIIDFDLQPVDFATVDGIINVIEYVPGDVNLDGEVNAIDVAVLRRYLAGWPEYQEICSEVADVNKDDQINAIDVALIRRYLVKWEGIVLQ